MITTFDYFYKKSGDEVSMHCDCLECEWKTRKLKYSFPIRQICGK